MINPLELIYPRPLKYLADSLELLVRGRLWLQVLIGMGLGIVVGILIGPSVGWVEVPRATLIGNWIALPGQLFLALIQMILVPLVIASVIRGLAASESVEQLRKLGLRVVAFFVITTAVAVTIGIWLALQIEPGRFIDTALLGQFHIAPQAAAGAGELGAPSLAELPRQITAILPTNPFGAMVDTQMLQLVVFSLIVGAALVMMAPEKSKPLLELLGSVQEVCMIVVRWAMWLAPLAVFGLVGQLTAKVGLSVLAGMAVYVLTVLLGLAVMLGLYLLLLRSFTEWRARPFLAAVRDVQLLAFSTSSTAAVMPLSMRTAEEALKVRPSIYQFVIPLGATINMNGTALYQGVATVFLAQVFGIELSTSALILVVVVAVGASIGSPATPGVGIVILSMVLASAGVPTSGIALLLGVDRILDMSRTAINVTGDMVACVLMERWVGGEQSAQQAVAAEAKRERKRQRTGEDIITESHKS